jgi:hypothetical protein
VKNKSQFQIHKSKFVQPRKAYSIHIGRVTLCDSIPKGSLGIRIFNGNHGSGTRLITFRNNGNVGIGVATYNSDAKLCVDGTIKSKEVIVTQNANDWLDWPDYVFEEGYELMTLKEVEKYVRENKHLPGIESQDEVNKNGINLGEISTILLKKIEELTLYSIEQNNRIKELEEKIK